MYVYAHVCCETARKKKELFYMVYESKIDIRQQLLLFIVAIIVKILFPIMQYIDGRSDVSEVLWLWYLRNGPSGATTPKDAA